MSLSVANVEIEGDPDQHVVSVMAPTVVKETVEEEVAGAEEGEEAEETESAEKE